MMMMWNLRFYPLLLLIHKYPKSRHYPRVSPSETMPLGATRCVVSQNRGEGARLVDSLIWMRVCCVLSSLRTNIKSVVIHTIRSKSECVQVQPGLHVVRSFSFFVMDSRCSPRIPLL
jgi:hypothetical protein